jgi:aspartyl-tRNA(Asn)/glutamyl-tRNA(Gln) amidotransferase subunit B
MNSFRGVRDALEYESRRQIKCLEKGQELFQETRLWDEEKKQTVLMRTKEEAHDYRYFPEPDLVDFTIDDVMISEQREYVGELPIVKKERFHKEYALSEKEIDVLLSDLDLANFFEASVKVLNDPKNIANWLLGPFLELANTLEGGFAEIRIEPDNFAKIVQYFLQGKINNLAAKKVLSRCITTNNDIDSIIESEGLMQVSGEDQLREFVEEVVKENVRAVNDVLEGRGEAIMFLVGQVMKKTKGKANPKVVKDMIQKQLLKKGGKL